MTFYVMFNAIASAPQQEDFIMKHIIAALTIGTAFALPAQAYTELPPATNTAPDLWPVVTSGFRSTVRRKLG